MNPKILNALNAQRKSIQKLKGVIMLKSGPESRQCESGLTLVHKHRLEVTYFLMDCLKKLGLHKSKEALQKEAEPPGNSFSEYLEAINQQANLEQSEKHQLIKRRVETTFHQLINDDLSKALHFFQQVMPTYFQPNEMNQFSVCFIQPAEVEVNTLERVFCLRMLKEESANIEKYRLNQFTFSNEIWFMSCNGGETVVIDKSNSAAVIRKDEILAYKERIHEERVSCVRWRDKQMFATGGEDRLVKLWNRELKCLKVIKGHDQEVNCLVFSDRYLISGGQDRYLILTNPDLLNREQNPLEIAKVTFRAVTGMVWLPISGILLCLSTEENKMKGNSHLSRIDIANFKQKSRNDFPEIVYDIQVEKCQKYLFANCSSNTIVIYELEQLSVIRRIRGFVQEETLMRMSIGGPQLNYLAVTSQNGELLIYEIANGCQVARIRSQFVIAGSVCWVDESTILIGYDNAIVERWTIKLPHQLTDTSLSCESIHS